MININILEPGSKTTNGLEIRKTIDECCVYRDSRAKDYHLNLKMRGMKFFGCCGVFTYELQPTSFETLLEQFVSVGFSLTETGREGQKQYFIRSVKRGVLCGAPILHLPPIAI